MKRTTPWLYAWSSTLCSVLACLAFSAQAATQTRTPTACTNDASTGTVAWTNPGNALTSNDSNATAGLAGGGTTSRYLACTGYNFALPATAVINGITVEVERRSSSATAGGAQDAAMRLIQGGVIGATDRSTLTQYTTADVIEPHGGATDLWGSIWTAVDINAANFGAAFAAKKNSAGGGTFTISVDMVRITVDYTDIAPVVSSFNVVEPGHDAVSGRIYTKVAGQNISVDIVALDPMNNVATAFTGTVAVELVDNSSGGLCLGLPLIKVLANETFTPADSGRHPLSAGQFEAEAYRNVKFRIKYPAAAPTVIACSGDAFANRPQSFTGFTVSDTDWQTAGTSRALDSVVFGAVTHKAGRPLSVRASAVNGAGAPAVTTNYTGSPTVQTTACAGAACPTALGTFALGAAFSFGQLNSDTGAYDNVGSIRVQLIDTDFAVIDAADTAGDCSAAGRYVCSGTLDVGRFVPDHFAISLNAPQFGTACGAGNFTYVGQLFNYTTQPVITVTARNFGNGTTTAYEGTWWRITNASLMPNTQAGRYSAASGTLDVTALPTTASDPSITVTGGGLGTLTFASSTGIAFSRSTPAAPFDAEIALAINLIDEDGVAFAGNPAGFGAASAGNGIAFSNGKAIRFGRLRLDNAVGSEKLDLPIPLRAEYWTGTHFALNTIDGCTTVTAKNFSLFNHQGGLVGSGPGANMRSPTATSDGNVSTSGTFAGGTASLTILKPNPQPTSSGSVDICLDLDIGVSGDLTCQAATAADKRWLQLLRTNPPNTYTQDPIGRAAFGLYGGQPNNFIYFRENY